MITDDKKVYFGSTFLSLIFIGLIVTDILTDYSEGGSVVHLVIEVALLGIVSFGFVYSLKELFKGAYQIKRLQEDIEALEKSKERWKTQSKSLIEGLSKKIDQQFVDWELTKSEIEVGFLLVKGLTQKEISETRSTSLKTTQHQCQSIYKKARVSGRTELAAFFLEDLLPGTE